MMTNGSVRLRVMLPSWINGCGWKGVGCQCQQQQVGDGGRRHGDLREPSMTACRADSIATVLPTALLISATDRFALRQRLGHQQHRIGADTRD